MHPPPSPDQANFTLMTECTPESRRYYSVYSVGKGSARPFRTAAILFCQKFSGIIKLRKKLQKELTVVKLWNDLYT